MDHMVGSLEAFKRAIWALRRKEGLNIEAVAVHPFTVPAVLKYVSEWGADPFPASRFSLRHPFRRRDPRPYIIGIPIEVTTQIEIGAIGMMGDEELRRKFDKYFLEGKEEEKPSGGETSDGGVIAELGKSSGQQTFTDLLVRAMEGLDKIQHVIVLRFHEGGMDSITDFNQLELQAALQRAAMRVMSGE